MVVLFLEILNVERQMSNFIFYSGLQKKKNLATQSQYTCDIQEFKC